MLRLNERKKRQICKVKQKQIKKIYIYILKINNKEKRTVGKANKGINIEKIIGLKIKIKKKGGGNFGEKQKPNTEAEDYNNNKKKCE